MTQGFFSIDDLSEMAKPETISDGTECFQCGLYKNCKSPKLLVEGKGKKEILVINAFPSTISDRMNRHMAGREEKQLKKSFTKIGVSLYNDCWVTSTICCLAYTKGTSQHRAPTTQEIALCRIQLLDTIAKLQPKLIITLGTIALTGLLGNRFSKIKLAKFARIPIPDRTFNTWIMAISNPANLDTTRMLDNDEALFHHDILAVADILKKIKKNPNLPKQADSLTEIECLINYKDIISILSKTLKSTPEFFYFDYETSGLKPHAPGHKIVYVSFTTDGKKAYSFPFQHKDFFTLKEQEKIKELLCAILTNERIEKLAHNIQFENSWSLNILNILPDPWGLDALIACHIWDNRRNFTSLKFQTYLLLGIDPYDKDIKQYLTADTSNGFNKVEQAPVQKMLTYSVLDSLFGFRVFKHYDDLFNKPENKDLLKAYNLFHEGTLSFSEMQENGICMNEEHYEKQKIKLTEEINTLKKEIRESKESKIYEKRFGIPIDIDSSKKLSHLLYTMLKYEGEANEKGNKSVDKETLEKIGTDFTKKIIKLRRLQKIVGTYIGQFQREIINGKIHPSYSLNIPISYRSSSSNPNWQNIPIREKLAREVCRGGVIPSPGNKILEADYSGVEVKSAACVTLDENLIKYVSDESTDMHTDSASDLWILPQKLVTKEIRQSCKGDWVFPQFYGSWYRECGKNLWASCIEEKLKLNNGNLLFDWIQDHGIKNKEQFIEHCKKVEKIFWEERFLGYAQWKKDNIKLYQKQGYITNLFGFRFSGHMKENDANNYPIQSLAFHCLLWSLNTIMDIAWTENWKSKVIGQIHDSIILTVVPEEEARIIKTINYVGTQLIRKEFPFLIVPLSIDFELTEVDAAWNTKKEIQI